MRERRRAWEGRQGGRGEAGRKKGVGKKKRKTAREGKSEGGGL